MSVSRFHFPPQLLAESHGKASKAPTSRPEEPVIIKRLPEMMVNTFCFATVFVARQVDFAR